MNIISKDFLVNEEIREKEIRVITSDGEQLGIISSTDALKIAEERELDLVMIAPTAKPPVCKIMNFGKFIYEQSKKDKEAKKKQKITNLKEVRLSPTIEEHNIKIKTNNTKKFNVTVEDFGQIYKNPKNLTINLTNFTNGKVIVGQHIALNLTRLSDGASKIT